MATRDEILNIIASMLTLPNAPKVTLENREAFMDAYYVQLEDIDIRMLNAAAAKYQTDETFFPVPGALRRKSVEIMLMASGIPTPMEAWAQVLNATKIRRERIRCPEGDRLEEIAGKEATGAYFLRLREAREHVESCPICQDAGGLETYGHPFVERTVQLMGGRDAILTDNVVSDRSQFLRYYQERLDREVDKLSQTPEVREMVAEQQRALFEDDRKSSLDTGEARELRMLEEKLTSPFNKRQA